MNYNQRVKATISTLPPTRPPSIGDASAATRLLEFERFAITKHGGNLTDLEVGVSLHQSPLNDVWMVSAPADAQFVTTFADKQLEAAFRDYHHSVRMLRIVKAQTNLSLGARERITQPKQPVELDSDP
jgi:hypothetical protein